VGKLENIKEDLAYVSKKVGYDIPIYHVKKSIYNGETYKDAYSQKSVDIVADLFGIDIQTFGYSYHWYFCWIALSRRTLRTCPSPNERVCLTSVKLPPFGFFANLM